MLILLEDALVEVATRAEALHLMETRDNLAGHKVLRMGQGDYVIRFPKLPAIGVDEIDIDHELCPVVARLIAATVSKEKGGIHAGKANRVILDYNAKVYELLDGSEADTDTEICTI